MTSAVAAMSRIRVLVLVLCGVTLAWLVLSRSFAAYLADAAPQAALLLNPRQPAALVNLADQAFNGVPGGISSEAENAERTVDRQGSAVRPDPPQDGAPKNGNRNRDFAEFNAPDLQRAIDLPAVRARVEASLAVEPLDARALRILGQAAVAAGDTVKAGVFMEAAAHLSLHESIALYWLLIQSTQAKDYDADIRYADILLRTRLALSSYVVPALAGAAEDATSAKRLDSILAADPPWRSEFLQNLPRAVTDERAPLRILLALRKSPKPPTAKEVNAFLDYLVQNRMYELAYYTWLQFLPPRELDSAGLLFNGDFESTPSGAPFDWLISEGAGVNVDIEQRADTASDHALVLEFEYGRVEYQSVRQLMKLPAGNYRLAGEYKGELVGPRGLRWRVACAESLDRPFAESAMIRGRTAAWSESVLDFTVPPQNCRAQYLSLDLDARMPSEQFLTGSMWFDKLRIQRLSGGPGE